MYGKIIVFILFLLVLNSCIAHKDIVNFKGDKVMGVNNNHPYKINVDDILYIEIKSSDEKITSIFKISGNNQANTNVTADNVYFTGYSVDRFGFIELPYLNKINVLGYTTQEVETKIRTELAKFIINTNDVFVSVKLSGFKYTILGEVGSSGTKYLYQNRVNLVDAIANAGDINITGDKKKIEIIRQNNNEVKKYIVDFTDMKVFESDVFFLQPNDIIYVPPLKQKTYGTGTTGAQTLSTVITGLSLITSIFLLFKFSK